MTTQELITSKDNLQRIIKTLQAQMNEIDAELEKSHPYKDANSLNMSKSIKKERSKDCNVM